MRNTIRKIALDIIKRSPVVYQFVRYNLFARIRSRNRRNIFEDIYKKNSWDGESSISGPGSSLAATQTLRNALPTCIARLGARSFLDIPCGDFAWMQHVDLGVETYIGADLVRPLIEKNRKNHGAYGEFVALDLLRDGLPRVDIVFCRDCLVHLSFREICRTIRNISKSGSKYLFATTFPAHGANDDTVTPYWRALNMQRPPIGFPPPLELLRDYSDGQVNDHGKYIGVWNIKDLTI